MRVKVTRLAVIHPPTTVQAVPQAERTEPVRVRPRPRGLWGRLWAWIDRRRAPQEQPVAPPDRVEHVGDLVEFLGWDLRGRPLFNPFPESVDRAVDYDRPLCILTDRRDEATGERLCWWTSPVQLVYRGREEDALPTRIETRTSLYSLTWID